MLAISQILKELKYELLNVEGFEEKEIVMDLMLECIDCKGLMMGPNLKENKTNEPLRVH